MTPETSHRRTFLGAAAAAAFQAFLWGRVQFWAAVAGAAVLAVVLAFVAARRFRGTDFSFRLRITSAWSLIALLSILCLAPIRAGAIPDRTLERGVIAVLAFIALLALLMALRAALGAAMRRPRFRRPALFLLGALLLALVAADLMQWVKPSGLSALACTTTLFRGNPDTRTPAGSPPRRDHPAVRTPRVAERAGRCRHRRPPEPAVTVRESQ